jgi:hypothetical protein
MELTESQAAMESGCVVHEAQRILDIDAQLEALGAQPRYVRVAIRSFIATSVVLMLWDHLSWDLAEIVAAIAIVYALAVWIGGVVFQIAEEHDRRAQLESELDTLLRVHEARSMIGGSAES